MRKRKKGRNRHGRYWHFEKRFNPSKHELAVCATLALTSLGPGERYLISSSHILLKFFSVSFADIFVPVSFIFVPPVGGGANKEERGHNRG